MFSFIIILFKYLLVFRGLGIGDWGLGPIPNPQSPIPKNLLKSYRSFFIFNYFINLFNFLIINLRKLSF